MAHYLVVGDQTVTDRLLIERAREIARTDRRAAFTLLVLAQNLPDRIRRSREERERIARERAREASAAFTRARLPVLYTEVGDALPTQAIDDELRRRPQDYQAILLATLPPGVNRWPSLAGLSRVQEQHRIPLFHVFAGGDESWAATERLRRMVALGMQRLPRPSHPSEEQAAFTSVREMWPILALLAVHAALGIGLAVNYDRQFLLMEAVVLISMSALVLGLWRFGGPPTPRTPRDG